MIKVPLIVMRLKDMTRVHPQQIEAECARCHALVAVYPSGQNIMKRYPGHIELVCQICRPADGTQILAPGAELEPFESKRKQ
jgi:hypothetical protein